MRTRTHGQPSGRPSPGRGPGAPGTPTHQPQNPTPPRGRVLRIDRSGDATVIADGLFFPTGMTLGPDGNLYVSNFGFGPPPVGLGMILRIVIN